MKWSRKQLPHKVWALLFRGGLVVGSQASAYAHGYKPHSGRDWDILIPYDRWRDAAMHIPRQCEPNGNRGWRFTLNEDGWNTTCDVWPDDLMRFLIESATKEGQQVFAFDGHGCLFTADRDRSDD